MKKSRKKIFVAADENYHTTVYDGLRYLGRFCPRHNGLVAYGARGHRLGVFATKDAARRAIIDAAEPNATGKARK